MKWFPDSFNLSQMSTAITYILRYYRQYVSKEIFFLDQTGARNLSSDHKTIKSYITIYQHIQGYYNKVQISAQATQKIPSCPCIMLLVINNTVWQCAHHLQPQQSRCIFIGGILYGVFTEQAHWVHIPVIRKIKTMTRCPRTRS